MTTAIHRTNYKYYTGVPDTLPTGVWLLNPDLSAVSGVPPIYWKVEGYSVLEMTQTEKNIKDLHLEAIHTVVPDQVAISGGVEVANQPIVIPFKPTQDANNKRAYIFSIDFCKQETWYVDSLPVTEVVGSGDGATTKFDLTHGSGLGEAIVDLYHFKVTDEKQIAPPGGSAGGYIPVVTVGGVQQTLREAFEESGGDCEVDHLDGSVTFFDPPASGEIEVSYYYVASGAGPKIQGGPPSGSMWIIDAAEAQFSSDINICDTIVQNVFTYHPVYGWIPIPEEMGGSPDAEYGTIGNYLDYSYGSMPVIPAIGGPHRGTQKSTVILRWDYEISIVLIPGLQIRVWTKHGRAFQGERATLVLYAKQVPYAG